MRIINGDCLTELKKLPNESVNCCVTSPPYYGLRDYGCAGQIGLESTPEAYVEKLVAVFQEVRRVLADDGTLWLNLGDSYCATTKGSGGHNEKQDSNKGAWFNDRKWNIPTGLKPKDLVGIPWRVAFALQADGWWLRQDIIWHKPNPMPESVRDRCTKAHEYIFLLTKSARYFYDADAIKEDFADDRMGNPNGGGQYAQNCPYPNAHEGQQSGLAKGKWNEEGKITGRNKRSVWTVTTKPYKEAHFATFPEEIPRTCILAGSKKGDTILDPFSGAGTTGVVAEKLGRDYILIELNPKYIEMADNRTWNVAPLFRQVE